MKLSIVIPAYNEEGSITETIVTLYDKLVSENIPHEIFVTNDNSKDNTAGVLAELCTTIPTLRWETNLGPNGFGYAVRYGLDRFNGDCVAIMMADLSDSPDDLVNYYRTLIATGKDCVFGSRFSKGGKVYDYPAFKLFLKGILFSNEATTSSCDFCKKAFLLLQYSSFESSNSCNLLLVSFSCSSSFNPPLSLLQSFNSFSNFVIPIFNRSTVALFSSPVVLLLLPELKLPINVIGNGGVEDDA